MYGDRVIVPVSLQNRVLQTLHAAHQGISSMESRAHQFLYWPGMHHHIQKIRDECSLCCKNAPSQPSLPACAGDIPSTPFDSIFSDYFDVGNRHFLLVGDRLSGWVEVFSAQPGSRNSGASGLQMHLQSFFSIFGVPEIISSGWCTIHLCRLALLNS